jgi:hypothetical protein
LLASKAHNFSIKKFNISIGLKLKFKPLTPREYSEVVRCGSGENEFRTPEKGGLLGLENALNSLDVDAFLPRPPQQFSRSGWARKPFRFSGSRVVPELHSPIRPSE